MPIFFIHQTSVTHLVTWMAWILLHTVWQGAAISALLWAMMRMIHATRSTVRYSLASAALIVLMLAPAVTGIMIRNELRVGPPMLKILSPSLIHDVYPFATRQEIVSAPATMTVATETSHTSPILRANATFLFSSLQTLRDTVTRYSGFLVALWLLGVTTFTTRLMWSFCAIRILRKSGKRVTESALLKAFAGLIQRMNLEPGIPLMESAAVCVPTVLGWLRPVILLPIACSSGLSFDQIEALLAHELAHIKRHDYLVNILQSFVEAVFFYHPSMWWISNTIRNEREHCCDAIAICLVNDRSLYASSLAALARLSISPRLSISARGGVLKARIQRILDIPTSAAPTSGPTAALTMVFLITVCVFAISLPKVGAADEPESDLSFQRAREACSAENEKLLNQGYYVRVQTKFDRNDKEFLFSKHISEGLYDIHRKDIRIIRRFASKPGTGSEHLDRWGSINAFDGKNSWEWNKPEAPLTLHPPQNGDDDIHWVNQGLPFYEPFSEAIGLPSPIQREALSVRGQSLFPFRLDVAFATGQYKVVAETVKIGEAICVCVEREGLDKIWLDPQKNWAIVRRDWNWGEGLPVRARIWNEGIEKQSGIWVPRSFRIEYFENVKSDEKTEPDSGVPATVVHGVVEEFRIAVPCEFVPSAPPGTPIIANTLKNTPEWYYMPRDPKITLAAFETENGISAKFEKNRDGSIFSIRSRQFQFILIGSILAIIGAILYASLRQRLRSEQ